MIRVFVLMALCAANVHAKGAGSIVITASVDGASVEIDGKVVGQTPLASHTVSAGSHKVKVKKLGFMEHAETVKVGNGKSAQVIADLLPVAGVLKITANVTGALVQVDGKSVGKAPLEVEIKLGKRTVVVSAPGYASFKTLVQAAPGNTYPFEVSLESVEGDLALEPLALAPLKPGKGKAAKKDELSLDLEPLTDAPPPSAKPAVLAVAPVSAVTEQEIAPAKPWYMEYWVWGAAAAVVVGGVVIAVAASGGDEKTTPIADNGWAPGIGQFTPPTALSFAP